MNNAKSLFFCKDLHFNWLVNPPISYMPQDDEGDEEAADWNQAEGAVVWITGEQ